MTVKNKEQKLEQEIRIKNRIIVLLISIIAFAIYKFANYPNQITVYTPPDISKGFVQKINDTPSETVYGFARTLWETLNYCGNDCSQDFPNQLEQYKGFLTKSCHQELKKHFNRNPALYDQRTRRLLPTEASIYDISRVKKISNDIWYVYLQYLLDDDIGGMTTRRQIMEYPLKITSSTVPSKYNPWGLAIDCFWGDINVKEYKELGEIK